LDGRSLEVSLPTPLTLVSLRNFLQVLSLLTIGSLHIGRLLGIRGPLNIRRLLGASFKPFRIRKVGRLLRKVGRLLRKVGRLLRKVGRLLRKVGRLLRKIGRLLRKIGSGLLDSLLTTGKLGLRGLRLGRTSKHLVWVRLVRVRLIRVRLVRVRLLRIRLLRIRLVRVRVLRVRLLRVRRVRVRLVRVRPVMVKIRVGRIRIWRAAGSVAIVIWVAIG